jgi:hypothetical protein
VAALLLLCFSLPPLHAQGPYLTRYVFLVAIDGIRNHEAFESGNLHIPCLWDSLRPLGAIHTRFWNRGITVTNAGHSTLFTGALQMLPNNSGIATPIRPLQPTLGEYFRRQRGTGPTSTYEISGKNTIWRYPVSLYPGYGYAWAPTVALASAVDTVTWDSTRTIIARDHPSLVYVLFAQVDKEGHTADTAKYLAAIHRADSLVWLLWNTIQNDSVYRDRTTMFVTSDHGRHDDAHGGWQGHGDWCHGCRHIPFLAIGPDILPGRVHENDRSQIDIAPTIAALLGIEVPLAEGDVMEELFAAPPLRPPSSATRAPSERNVSTSDASSRSPSIAAGPGLLHLLYSEGEEGEREILYTASNDAGDSWTPAVPLFTTPDGQFVETAVTCEGDFVAAAATGWTRFPGDSSTAWVLDFRTSTDAGATWSAPLRLDTLGTISTAPSVALAGDRISIVANAGYAVWSYRSTDRGATFTIARTHTASSTTPVCALRDTVTVAAWRHLNADVLPFWNILADRTPWRTGDHPVTMNDTASYSYAPSIAVGGDSLTHLVYVHHTATPMENRWELHYRSNPGTADAWSDPLMPAPGRNAFAPRILRTPGGVLHVIWEDEENNLRSIRGCSSANGGATWTPPRRYTSEAPWACRPSSAERGDTLFIAWQDYRDGNWEIYVASVPVSAHPAPAMPPGWNLVALPADCPDGSVQALFPGCLSQAYSYGPGGYTPNDTLTAGPGYWVNLPDGWSGYPAGLPRWCDTLDVRQGWNLVGTISDPVPAVMVQSDPPDLLQTPFYGFSPEGYIPAAVLEPGRAYWVKCEGTGRIRIGGWSGQD